MTADSPATVRVAFQPTPEDYHALYRHSISNNLVYRGAQLAVFALVTLQVALCVAADGLAGVVDPRSLIGLGLLAVWAAGPIFTRWRIARLYGKSEPPNVEYRIDQTGIHGRSAWSPWKDVTRVDETADAFFVGIRPGAGAYLPKRAIADADLAQLKSLIQTNIGARARLLPDLTERS